MAETYSAHLENSDVTSFEINEDGNEYSFADEYARENIARLDGTVSELNTQISGKLDNPTGGSEGQVLTKTASGVAWADSTGGSNFSLMSLHIATNPTKTSYYGGEDFDSSGMVVTANYGNGYAEMITDVEVSGYTVVFGNSLAVGTTSLTVSYTESATTVTTTVPITVTKRPIPIPTVSGSYTYSDGSTINPTFNNYPSSYITGSGDLSATAYGSYNALFNLNDTVNCEWSDGTITEKSAPWSVAKKSISAPTLSKTTITLNSSVKFDSFTVTREGDGVISVTSSNPSVATAVLNGTTVTVTSVNDTTGTVTVTVSVAEGTNWLAPSDSTCAVTAQFLPVKGNALNTYSWDEIRQVSDAGQASNYWNVGDTKTITINGTVGTFTFSNLSIDAFIIGFNHNSAKEGTNRIHFQIGKISNKLVSLCDSSYGTNAGSTGGKYFQMNHWGNASASPYNTNYGGWKACDLRFDTLGSTNVQPSGYGATKTTSCVGYDPSGYNIATSPKASTLLAALPSALRSVMKSVTKYTDNTGNSSNVAANVTASVDYLFLLSEWEYFGARTYANEYEKNSQEQYAYYSAGNGKIHYKHSDTGTAVTTWERSPYYSSDYSFCFVSNNGSAIASTSRFSYGLSPGFCV